MSWVLKVNASKAIATNVLVKKVGYDTKIVESEKKIVAMINMLLLKNLIN